MSSDKLYKGFRISIHVPRERDDAQLQYISNNIDISIHVPRERDDGSGVSAVAKVPVISIHVPRERDD